METKLENIIRLITVLNGNREWKHARDLSTELGVSVRTVMRYLDEIDGLIGFPILERSKSGFRIFSGNFVDVLANRDEFSHLAALKTTPLGGLINTTRIEIPIPVLRKIQEMIEIKGSIHDEFIRNIFHAMRDGEFLLVDYQSKTATKRHRGVPIKLYLDYSILYVAFYDTQYGYIILLAGSKIKSVYRTHKFLKDSDLETYRNYVNKAWGKMIRHKDEQITEVRFRVDHSIIAHFRNNPLHHTQSITEAEDGYVISLLIHNPIEFIRWSLRFGDSIRIIDPPEIIAELKRYLDSISEGYSENQPCDWEPDS